MGPPGPSGPSETRYTIDDDSVICVPRGPVVVTDERTLTLLLWHYRRGEVEIRGDLYYQPELMISGQLYRQVKRQRIQLPPQDLIEPEPEDPPTPPSTSAAVPFWKRWFT